MKEKLGFGCPLQTFSKVDRHNLDTSKKDQRAQWLARFFDLKDIHEYATKNQQAVFIRENLPELVQFRRVSFNMDDHHWLVHLDSLRFPTALHMPLTIGGCVVYIAEKPTLTLSFWNVYHDGDIIHAETARSNPRHMIEDKDSVQVANRFVKSIGMRVVAYGHVDVMYANGNDMNSERRRLIKIGMLPSRILGFGYDMKVAHITPSIVKHKKDFNIVLNEAKPALLSGMEYYWQRELNAISKAYIWRTEPDDPSVAGYSGGAVFIGERAAATTCLAGIFQSYENYLGSKSLRSWVLHDWRPRRAAFDTGKVSYKGGFMLPTPSRSSVPCEQFLGQVYLAAAVSTSRSKLLNRPRHEENPYEKN